MSVYARFGVPTVINAAGTVTRLSGGHMHQEVLAAMRDAAGACVDMVALQAGASRVIARVTGAEAGIVTSGASAALLLGAAACLAGLDPARMNRLPEVAEGRNEIIVVRSQRNMYDRALTVAGGRIVEVGIADRYSGSGVRDAAPWEIEAAITPRTAAICYLAQPQSLPSLTEVSSVAHAHAIPVLVDAAAQLPPKDNLRRFLTEGADLVAFSGGKAIGGPQSSGILAGRADLVASALMQMLDLDLFADTWNPPEEFARLRQLRGLPQHGIGRSCKVGKEEVVGLLVALERFAAMDDSDRQAEWRGILQAIVDAAEGTSLQLVLLDRPMPLLEVHTPDATALAAQLAAHDPPIHCSVGRRDANVLVISPAALTADEAVIVGGALRGATSPVPLFAGLGREERTKVAEHLRRG
jgi:L-seryl-tRNA(Ser) seleniumtransferase